MRANRWAFTVVLAIVAGLAVLLFLVLEDGASPPPAEPPEPPAADTATPSPPPATPAPTAAATPTATPTSTPAVTPTATPAASPDPARATPAAGPDNGRPARCATVAGRGARLIESVEEAMTDYEGVWGLALIDLDCGSSVVVRPRHSQYPASAGKVVILTAALRAVQDGLLEFELIEEAVELVLHYSLDKQTDEIAELITPEQVAEVMVRAGVTSSYLEWHWRKAWFTPHDLARVWASIVRGEQLDERWTAHLLRLASEVVLPEGKEAFPADFGVEGYRYGQKAGYWTPEEESDIFVSAGYVVPEDGASTGFTFAFLIETWEEDIFEPKRRAVFPLVRDFMVAEMER